VQNRDKKHFRFHLLALPFLPITKKYSVDAFQSKVHKLARMLLSKGHTVFLYGTGYTDFSSQRLIFEKCAEMDEIVAEYGEGFDSELGYDIQKGTKHDLKTLPTEMTKAFHARVIQRIRSYQQDDDFLLLSQGVYQRDVATAINLKLTVEPGIGYLGSFAPYRAFESSFLQAFTYGKEHPTSDLHRSPDDRVIPNYFDPEDFEFNDKPKDYLLFMGRLNPQKGTLIALRIAIELNMPIKIAGQGDISFMKNYPKAEYLGVLDSKQRKDVMKNALVTLVPSQYLEPFAGVQVESMLSGTPVVTSDHACFPEINENGISGYRANTIGEFIEATQKAMGLDRKGVREYGEQFLMDNVNEKFQKWWEHLYKMNFKTQKKLWNVL